MTPYIVLLALSMVTATIWTLDRKNRTVYFMFLAVVLILFSGLRYKVGTDYESYEALYQDVLDDWVSSEVGYIFLIHLTDRTGLGFFGLMFTVSFLTISFATAALRKFHCGIHSLYIYLSIPLFYLLSLNTIRQSLAAAIFMLATQYARNRDPRRFFALVLLAASFHVSALLLAPIYFIANRRPTYTFLAACLLAGVFVAFNIPIAVELLGFHPVYLEEKEGSALGQFVICLVTAVFLIHVARSTRNSKLQEAPLINYLSIAAGICFASLFSTVGASFILRMTTYFTWAIAVLIPHYIGQMRRAEDRRVAFVGLYMLAAIYFLTTVNRGEDIDLVPYQTILISTQY